MGRAKSSLQLIKKEKLRNTIFQMKNNTLKKKIYELTTLCDIKAALIVYGPKKDTWEAHSLEPEIWPQNRDEVIELINKYKVQSPENRETRTSLLSHFFSDKIKKAQETLTKQRNDNVESKYPTWCRRLDSFKEEDLRKSIVSLDDVIGNAKVKLEQMKANIHRSYQQQMQHQQQQIQQQQMQQQQQQQMQQQQQQMQQQMMLSKKRKMDSDAENQPPKYLKIDPHQTNLDPGRVPFPSPLMDYRFNRMIVNFDNEYARGTSNIIHNVPIPDVYYPMMVGIPERGYVNNMTWAPPNYYGDGRPPIQPYIMGYQTMPEGSNSYPMASNQFCENHKWLR